MIHGILEIPRDPYSHFEAPAEHELSTDQLEGKFGSIGFNLDYDPIDHIVFHPFAGEPAKKVGILDRDLVVEVDGWQLHPHNPMRMFLQRSRVLKAIWFLSWFFVLLTIPI